ncbi:hypothetical protein Goari_008590, partial [Gossypium aridum]|nr:hypothetical protein [Gossypium aridum]
MKRKVPGMAPATVVEKFSISLIDLTQSTRKIAGNGITEKHMSRCGRTLS